MNKKVLIAAALIASMFAQAQESGSGDEVKNKKGNEILPKEGDIALGFNTIPLLDLVFGTLSRNPAYLGAGNVVSYTQNSNNQIVAKYFLTKKTAVRARVGINTLGGSITNRVQDSKVLYDAGFGTADDMAAAALYRVEDKVKFSKSNWMVSVGYEMRRGYRRLQGYYGGEIGFGGSSSRESITYGNAFSDMYSVEYTNDFNTSNVFNHNPLGGRQARALEVKSRGGFRAGVRGFIGIEYFIFAKISLSAEYGWGWSFTSRTKSTTKQEVYFNGENGPTVVVEDVNNDSNERTRGFSVDNNNNNPFSMNNTLNGNTTLAGGAGALTLIFHF